jgi:hypothetical protein
VTVSAGERDEQLVRELGAEHVVLTAAIEPRPSATRCPAASMPSSPRRPSACPRWTRSAATVRAVNLTPSGHNRPDRPHVISSRSPAAAGRMTCPGRRTAAATRMHGIERSSRPARPRPAGCAWQQVLHSRPWSVGAVQACHPPTRPTVWTLLAASASGQEEQPMIRTVAKFPWLACWASGEWWPSPARPTPHTRTSGTRALRPRDRPRPITIPLAAMRLRVSSRPATRLRLRSLVRRLTPISPRAGACRCLPRRRGPPRETSGQPAITRTALRPSCGGTPTTAVGAPAATATRPVRGRSATRLRRGAHHLLPRGPVRRRHQELGRNPGPEQIGQDLIRPPRHP